MSTQTITIIAAQLPGAAITGAELLDPAGPPIPVLVVDFDERQGCILAHEYLAAHDYAEGLPAASETDLPDYCACTSYQAGRCAGWPSEYCLFEEPADSAGWGLVRRWRLLPGGGICRADGYADMLADLRAWPAAKPVADLVVRSFGIEADADGTVLDRMITTTVEDLTLSLAWALALVGCDEREIPEIMAVWAPWADLGDPLAEIELPASSVYGALSQAATYGVRLAETEALLAEVAL